MTSTQPEFPFRAGDVLNYTPKHRHARSHAAVVETIGPWADLVAFDIYWSADRTRLTGAELETATVRFNLDDFEEVQLQVELQDFHPDDRNELYNPNGRTRYFRRKGAVPDLGTQLSNTEGLLADANEELAHWTRKKAELEAQASDLRVRVRLAPPRPEPAAELAAAPAGASA